MKNPQEALEALADPAPLTMGQIALLDLYKSPLLHGDIDDLSKVTFSLWLLSMPIEQAVAEARFPDRAIVWADGVTQEEFDRRLVDALAAIAAFYHVLPRPENGDGGALKKKRAAGSATATSPSSPSTSAERTAGRCATCSTRSPQSRRGSSTASGRRGREV